MTGPSIRVYRSDLEQQILDVLAKGPLTMAELVHLVEASPTWLHAVASRLIDEGVIMTTKLPRRVGRGRPSLVYALTEAA